MSRTRSKAILNRAERLPGVALPMVLLIEGDPESQRILGFNLMAGQAMIETDLIEATPGETAKAFERRLVAMARERGVGIISLGSDEPKKPCRFDMVGKLLADQP